MPFLLIIRRSGEYCACVQISRFKDRVVPIQRPIKALALLI